MTLNEIEEGDLLWSDIILKGENHPVATRVLRINPHKTKFDVLVLAGDPWEYPCKGNIIELREMANKAFVGIYYSYEDEL